MPKYLAFEENKGLQLKPIKIEQLPLLLVGPVLRRLTRTHIAIFLVLKTASSISVEVRETDAPNVKAVTAVTADEGVRFGEHAYAYVVDCAAPSDEFVAEFKAETQYSYRVTLTGSSTGGGQPSSNLGVSGLGLNGQQDPSFWGLPKDPDKFSVLHASCRRPHGNFRDGLARAIEELEGSSPPSLLILSGDQIYADDAATVMLALMQAIGKSIINVDESDVFHLGIQEFGHRQALTNLYGLSGDMAANHLFTLNEFYSHYLLVWTDLLWPETFPESWDDVRDQVLHGISKTELLQKSWKELKKRNPELREIAPEIADDLWAELNVQWGQTAIWRRLAVNKRKHDDAPRVDITSDITLEKEDVRPWPLDDLLVSADTGAGKCRVTFGNTLRTGAEVTVQKIDTSSHQVEVFSQVGRGTVNGWPSVSLDEVDNWLTFAVAEDQLLAYRHQGDYSIKERKLVNKGISLRRDQLVIWDGISRVHILADATNGPLMFKVFAELPVDVEITIEKVDSTANAIGLKAGTDVILKYDTRSIFDDDTTAADPVIFQNQKGYRTLTFQKGHRTLTLTSRPKDGDRNTYYKVEKQIGNGLDELVQKDEKREKVLKLAWKEEVERLKAYRDTLPTIRKILANVPTLLTFDDHEVTDDWNLNYPWFLFAYGQNMFTGKENPGGQVVCNGLMAYLVFQHWGNVPERVRAGSAERQALSALTWSSSQHPGYEAMRSHLGLPAYGMKYIGADPSPSRSIAEGVYEEWTGAKGGTDHYLSDGFNLRVYPDSGIRWDYRFGEAEGYPVHLVVLDERTWRYCPHYSGPAGRISPTALDLMWPAPTAGQADMPTFLVAPAPVLGLHVIEHVIQPLFGLTFQSGAATYDWEGWGADRRMFEKLLERIASWKQVVILSGDVHFSYTKTLDYQKGDIQGRAVQFVSSSAKYSDPKTLMLMLMGEFMKKVGVVRKREYVGWRTRKEADPTDKLLQLPHTATNVVKLPWDEVVDVAFGRVSRWGNEEESFVSGSSATNGTGPLPFVLSREIADVYKLSGHSWHYTIEHVDDPRLEAANTSHMQNIQAAENERGWNPQASINTVKALRSHNLTRIGRVMAGAPTVARIELTRDSATGPLRARQTLLLSPGTAKSGAPDPRISTSALLASPSELP
ncbi:MAG: hypothetical protein AAFZ17_00705 [Cyanobacteria bacterium J06650_10]